MIPSYEQLMNMRVQFVNVCTLLGKNPKEADEYFTTRCKELGWIPKDNVDINA